VKPTKGAEILRSLVSPKQHTQASIARELKVTPEAVRHWCTGSAKPKDKLRRRLEKLTGVPATSWDEPVQQQEQRAVGEAAA